MPKKGPGGQFHTVPFMFAKDGHTYAIIFKPGFTLPATMSHGADGFRAQPVVLAHATNRGWAELLTQLLNDEWNDLTDA